MNVKHKIKCVSLREKERNKFRRICEQDDNVLGQPQRENRIEISGTRAPSKRHKVLTLIVSVGRYPGRMLQVVEDGRSSESNSSFWEFGERPSQPCMSESISLSMAVNARQRIQSTGRQAHRQAWKGGKNLTEDFRRALNRATYASASNAILQQNLTQHWHDWLTFRDGELPDVWTAARFFL